MDLKIFFNKLPDEIIDKSGYGEDELIEYIEFNDSFLKDIEYYDIALVGITEQRGGKINLPDTLPDNVRRQLFRLKKGNGRYKIIDLGNLRNGPNSADTYHRIKEVLSYLLDKNIFPLMLGGTHDVTLAQYTGYQEIQKFITLLNVDNKIDINSEDQLTNQNFLAKVLSHEPNYLFNYNQIGHQSYLVTRQNLQLIYDLNFSAIRLGNVNENFSEIEPIIRESDMMTFDLSSISVKDSPGGRDSKIFGLNGKQACQIFWYAGLNDKLSSIGIHEYDESKDFHHRTPFLVATMIWYFIEGFYQRKDERIFKLNEYLSYEVFLNNTPSSIIFYKSKISEKWWMEIPGKTSEKIFSRNQIIPCSYSDYEKATKGEIPDRWIKAVGMNN